MDVAFVAVRALSTQRYEIEIMTKAEFNASMEKLEAFTKIISPVETGFFYLSVRQL